MNVAVTQVRTPTTSRRTQLTPCDLIPAYLCQRNKCDQESMAGKDHIVQSHGAVLHAVVQGVPTMGSPSIFEINPVTSLLQATCCTLEILKAQVII